MNQILTALLMLMLTPLARAGDGLSLRSPLDWQVIQRRTLQEGIVPLAGRCEVDCDRIEARMTGKTMIGAVHATDWLQVQLDTGSMTFRGSLATPAGAWYSLDVRARKGPDIVATVKVEHVGVGEIFVVAGQSNSANHGDRPQTPKSGRVVAFDGRSWQLANDPQPGASGSGGSFMPAFGDAMVERFHVPVGLVACGIGATSVREWLPKGSTFPNPPTLTGNVTQRPDGTWASNGAAFEMFTNRMKHLGPHGFRAVLWHQGESDANQPGPSTLPGNLYREYLERLIRESRREIGWDAPWFVAQASYHAGDEGSHDIRAAQAALWKDGLAEPGPNTDDFKGDLRGMPGNDVHFSEKGLRVHGEAWAEKVGAWLDRRSHDSNN